jgi:hypothetical protein
MIWRQLEDNAPPSEPLASLVPEIKQRAAIAKAGGRGDAPQSI